ncbi:MAG: hypothetical protein L6461_14070 [Anaerolineae bacterium]|nr:hypothetical protein [Anaerolineae bacterium]
MSLGSYFTNWLSTEPMASAVMFIAALLLFGLSFVRLWSEKLAGYERIWQVFILLSRTGCFLALLWGGYFLLNESGITLNKVLDELISGGKTGRMATRQLQTNWGTGLYQSELKVNHFVEKQFVEEIVQGSDKPILYLSKKHFEELKHESITAFTGNVNLHLIDPQLANYEVDAKYSYAINNQADEKTIARFSFPLPPSRTYENLTVVMDEKDVSWTLDGNAIIWEAAMRPLQSSHVTVSYRTSGTNIYQYSIASPKAIHDFSLTISANTAELSLLNSVESDAIQYTYRAIKDSGEHVLNWKIDRAIMAPLFGIRFQKRIEPVYSKSITEIMHYAARAFVLLLSLVTLTLIICGISVDLWRLALMGCIFATQFLCLVATYPVLNNFVFPLLLIGAFSFLLYLKIFKNIPPIVLTLILVLAAVFGLMYPFAGLLTGERERNALDGILQAGMILYLFGLTLYMRVRSSPNSL